MPDQKLLRGQVALVTGAGVRVGRAIALALAENGATVALHYHTSARPAESVANLLRRKHHTCELFQADLADDPQRQELIPQINHKLGTVHLLVNSAAVFGEAPMMETTLNEWDENFDLNLEAPFRLSQAFAAQHGGKVQGTIVNISDWRGLYPSADHFAYTITKAALIKMTEAMALSLAPRIRVNCLALGAILPPPRNSRKKMNALLEKIPLKTMGAPQDVAAALLYLIGPGRYVTGETILVDGGRHLVR